MGWRRLKIALIGVLILLPLIILSPSAYADPPQASENNNCIIYAYTESSDHKFLIDSNLKAFGNNITIVNNCDRIEVYTNSNFTLSTNNSIVKFPVNFGIQNISIITENRSINYFNVTIMPDRLSWEFEYFEWQNDYDYSVEEYISLTASQAKENWAAILSIVLVFTLVTMVYWNLINSYIDRNYCEEVKL